MSQRETDTENIDAQSEKPTTTNKRKYLKYAAILLGLVVVVVGSYTGYVYAASPAVIRNPELEHYHFRMQILVDGKAEDFGSKAYQTGYAKDQCNANLPEQPIHFHDNKDQFTHIHWEGMTGGMVMKYYGWNYIGGMNNALGYKLDKLSDPQKVTTHGNYLPPQPKESSFYIYSGDEKGYKQRNFNDWVGNDLEDFFKTTSNFPAHEQNKKTSLVDKIFPKAFAHGTEDHSTKPTTTTEDAETEEQKLTRINNLIGNVVIFVQKDKPTDVQIKERLNKLEPLSDSTCGG